MFTERPTFPCYGVTYDVEYVLDYFKKCSFSIENSKILATMMCLLSGQLCVSHLPKLQRQLYRQMERRLANFIINRWKTITLETFYLQIACNFMHIFVYCMLRIVVCIIYVVLYQFVLWRRSGIFIVNFEHISHLVLVFLLLTLNI